MLLCLFSNGVNGRMDALFGLPLPLFFFYSIHGSGCFKRRDETCVSFFLNKHTLQIMSFSHCVVPVVQPFFFFFLHFAY
ncbi:hypothetical protein J3F84DRAFT_141653 [Trichoderma pleuroticola]